MNSRSPRFSIILPTRNRGHLIRYAIESALAQDYDDFEFVISNNDSNDATEDVVQSFSSPRIRYVRTPNMLSMPDSWEFALGQARGEWITVLEDDNVISSRLLSTLDTVTRSNDVPSFTWRMFNYYGDQSRHSSRRNTYTVHRFTSEVRLSDARTTLQRLYSFVPDITVPKLLNSCCHRSIVERVVNRTGRFFHPPAPDFTAGCAILAHCERYGFIDAPLALSAAGDTSPHASQPNFRNFKGELRDQGASQHLPFAFEDIGPWNIIAESLAHMKSLLPEQLEGIEFDVDAFAIDCYTQMEDYKGWSDLPRHREVLDRFLAAQDLRRRTRIRLASRRATLRGHLRNRVSEVILSSPSWLGSPVFLNWCETRGGRKFVRGAEAGFHDILGALQHLDTTVFTDLDPEAKNLMAKAN